MIPGAGECASTIRSPFAPTEETSYTSLSRQQEWMDLADAMDVMPGTLDALVLKALSLEPLHGWGISDRIRQLSRDAFRIGQGSLYPALHRYERDGWVTS